LLVGAHSGRKTASRSDQVQRHDFAEYPPSFLNRKMLISIVTCNGSSSFMLRYGGTSHTRSCAMPELAISPEKVGFLIEKAREFDAKDVPVDPDSESNGADDDMIDVLEDSGADPVVREITGFINALTEDEQIDLVALMRLGRGDGTIEDWNELRRDAAEGRNGRTATYLLGEPMLGDLLAEGLEEFGLSWTDERTAPVR